MKRLLIITLGLIIIAGCVQKDDPHIKTIIALEKSISELESKNDRYVKEINSFKLSESKRKPSKLFIVVEKLKNMKDIDNLMSQFKANKQYDVDNERKWVFKEQTWNSIEDIHKKITTSKKFRLGNFENNVELKYNATATKSQSGARISIQADPVQSVLTLVTPIDTKGVTSIDTKGNRRLGELEKTEDGKYEFYVTFSYLKSVKYIYFYSSYKNSNRYYRFNLKTEKQESLEYFETVKDFENYANENE